MVWAGLRLTLPPFSFAVPARKGIDTLPSGERVGYNNMIYHEHEVRVRGWVPGLWYVDILVVLFCSRCARFRATNARTVVSRSENYDDRGYLRVPPCFDVCCGSELRKRMNKRARQAREGRRDRAGSGCGMWEILGVEKSRALKVLSTGINGTRSSAYVDTLLTVF